MSEPSGTLPPVGAELGRGDENTERRLWEVPVRRRERMMKLKRRKHINDDEVQRVEVPANMQQNEVSDADQGGQIANTPPQIQGLTAVNHYQDTPFVKTWSHAEAESTAGGQGRGRGGGTLRRAEGTPNLATTRQLPGINTIQPRSEWVAALNAQKRRVEQTKRQRTREVKEAKKWALKIPKKPVSPEEKRERNRRKNDRHKALKTPQMIADEKGYRQKLWKGELAQLPISRRVQFWGQSGPVS